MMWPLLERRIVRLTGGTAAPPPRPPLSLGYFPGDDQPPEEGECPKCRFEKSGVCLCGYDWTNWQWVDV